MPKSTCHNGSPAPKILLASSDVLLRKGLLALCREEFGRATQAVEMGLVINVISNPTLVRILREGWGLAVLDLPLHGLQFLNFIAANLERAPNVLVIGEFPEDEFAFRSMKNGALGYLRKNADEETLRAAMRKTAAGRRYLAPEVAVKLADRLMGNVPVSPLDALSDREYQVFRMLRESDSVGRIAASLGLSAKTVYAHRERMRKKLGKNYEVLGLVI